jgi:hypothetical protein
MAWWRIFIWCDIKSCRRWAFHRCVIIERYTCGSRSETLARLDVIDTRCFAWCPDSSVSWVSICVACLRVRIWSSWMEGSFSQLRRDWTRRVSAFRYRSARSAEALAAAELAFLEGRMLSAKLPKCWRKTVWPPGSMRRVRWLWIPSNYLLLVHEDFAGS